MRRSTSKRKQFKRLIPLVLLTVALGACGAKNGSSTSTNSSSTSKVTTVKLSNYFSKTKMLLMMNQKQLRLV